jgi:hypothetical protein
MPGLLYRKSRYLSLPKEWELPQDTDAQARERRRMYTYLHTDANTNVAQLSIPNINITSAPPP